MKKIIIETDVMRLTVYGISEYHHQATSEYIGPCRNDKPPTTELTRQTAEEAVKILTEVLGLEQG